MLIDRNIADTTVRRSLILAGGGMRVAYQAGVLLALEESGVKFSHVDGTSGGIFNTAMLASGLRPEEIAEKWRTLKLKNFISRQKFRSYLKPFFMKGYADADNIRHKVFPHLGIDLQAIRGNGTINATFNVCNFSKKTIEAIGNQDVHEDHLIAGVSLPIFMPALLIKEDWYTDAVWIKDANLSEAVRQQSTELWLVWAIGNSRTYLPGAFNQYVHMIEMSANGALLEEFKLINQRNRELSLRPEHSTQDCIKLKVIKSADALPLDPDLFFNKINTRELINMGYQNAKTYLMQDSPAIEMDENATKSNETGSVLSFRATFKGKLLYNSEKTRIIYYTYFQFNLLGENQILSLYSSIFIEVLSREIPAYDHEVRRKNEEGVTVLEIRAKMLIKEVEYHIQSTVKMFSPMENLIGLGMKKANLILVKRSDSIDTVVLKGDLFQSASARLKSVFFTSVKNEKGKAGGLGKRIDLISRLVGNQTPSHFPSTQDVSTEKSTPTNL